MLVAFIALFGACRPNTPHVHYNCPLHFSGARGIEPEVLAAYREVVASLERMNYEQQDQVPKWAPLLVDLSHKNKGQAYLSRDGRTVVFVTHEERFTAVNVATISPDHEAIDKWQDEGEQILQRAEQAFDRTSDSPEQPCESNETTHPSEITNEARVTEIDAPKP